MFVLMSGKRKRDYRKVLNKVLESLPGAPAVRSAVIDFELTLWKAFPKVYPGVYFKVVPSIGHRQYGERFNS